MKLLKQTIRYITYALLSSSLKKYGSREKIYLTFDDGPHPENTPRILDILGARNIKATFFMVGVEMEKYPDIVDAVIREGHQIGYHSHKHASLHSVSLKQVIHDMKMGERIGKRHGLKMKLYRPPYGDLTITSLIFLIVNGWKIIMWSKDSRDSFDTPEVVLDNVSSKYLCPGEILLFHDDYKDTVNILAEILDDIIRNNLKCGLFVE